MQIGAYSVALHVVQGFSFATAPHALRWPYQNDNGLNQGVENALWYLYRVQDPSNNIFAGDILCLCLV